jgi:chromosome segregation ATPase
MSHLKTGVDVLPQEDVPAPAPVLSTDEELTILRELSGTLQARIDELEQMLEGRCDEGWSELEREYEALIEEKSEMIRSLHHKNTELRERAGSASPAVAPAPVAVEEPPDRQELLQLQREVQEQRKQMQDDEESMMAQMRQMEMALAKDRAELARQRAEMQRLHDELKHELDVAARDGGLRERLGALQRGMNQAGSGRATTKQDAPSPNQPPKPPATVTPTPNKSGLFRRIFGQAT